MDLTIVIPYYNEKNALQRLLKTIPENFKTIVVNDISDVPPEVSRHPNVELLNLNKKGYFSGAVNTGIRSCRSDVLVLNQDVRFEGTQAFDLIANHSEEYAMIGERIQGHHPAWPNGYIHGTFMFMRRDAIDTVGLLDEQYYPLWGSTCEWQLRACRKDYKVLPVQHIPGFTHDRSGGIGNSIQQLLRKEPKNRSLLIRTPPLISVIVPSYRHGQYAEDLINSLMGGKSCLGQMEGQTLQSFELIIADDCSDDGSYELLKEFDNPWKGIRVVQTDKNGGTSIACNRAIKEAKAKIIARIDGDDMRESTSLEAMYEKLRTNMHSFVYDNVILFTNGQRVPKAWKMPKIYDFDELIMKNKVHAGIMFPKKAWAEVGGYPENMIHGRDDWAFNVALEVKGYCGVHSESTGYLYRREGQNRTLRNTTPNWRASFAAQLKELFPEIYEGVRPMGCCGNRASTPRTPTSGRRGGTYSMPTSKTPGASGSSILEYQGSNYGNETYIGPFTGAPYIFSVKKNRRRVDNRDLHQVSLSGKRLGLLDLLQTGGKPLFVAVPTTPKEEVKPLVEAVVEETEETVEPEVVEEPSFDFTAISGIGKATALKLETSGVHTLEDLVDMDTPTLAEVLNCAESRAAKILDNIPE